jgi:hypothetical protein
MRSQAWEGVVEMMYHVRVERGEKYWLLHVAEIDRWTQARNLREVEPMARDLIAIMEDVPSTSFELDIDITAPATVAAHLDRSRQLIEQAATARAAAAFEARVAALMLHDDGVPLRDVGTILGVSYQRAHQLVTEAEAQATAKELQLS